MWIVNGMRLTMMMRWWRVRPRRVCVEYILVNNSRFLLSFTGNNSATFSPHCSLEVFTTFYFSLLRSTGISSKNRILYARFSHKFSYFLLQCFCDFPTSRLDRTLVWTKFKTRLCPPTSLRELKISWKLCHTFMVQKQKSQQLSLISETCDVRKRATSGRAGLRGNWSLSSALNLSRSRPTDPMMKMF